jgi:hypothetical protein
MKKFLSFGLKKNRKRKRKKIPILRCRYTAANYTIDVSFENVLTENTRIIHIKYVHLNCCIDIMRIILFYISGLLKKQLVKTKQSENLA